MVGAVELPDRQAVSVVLNRPFFLLKDPLEDVVETTSPSVTNSAAELLKQGAGNQPVPDKHHESAPLLVPPPPPQLS